MTLFLLAYLAGVLTIVSPCILPVLPFVLARVDQPFRRGGLPMLVGMAIAFAAVASLAAFAGGWAVELNRHARTLALMLIALFGLALLFPALSARLMAPVVALGGRLSRAADHAAARGAGFGASALLGIATGLLWAPCAGPVLGLILAGAALAGPSLETSLALLAYASGAATSLAAALLFGGRLLRMMRRSLSFGDRLRRVLGAGILAAVLAISLGLDVGLLTRLSANGTVAIEQSLIDTLQPARRSTALVPSAQAAEIPTAPLFGATQWLNTAPLTADSVTGKVVLVNFWTYSCINCLRTLPYARAWADKYRDQGLVVIGVHAPEFAFEKDIGNVRAATAALGVGYPVAIDNDYAIWRAFDNHAWPALYVIDAQGHTRHHQFGEGDFAATERVIRQLLAEAGHPAASGMAEIRADGVGAAADLANLRSPETYLGYDRARGFASPGGAIQDVPSRYAAAAGLRLNQWSLSGLWTIAGEHVTLDQPGGRILHRFQARDLHLVMGPSADGKPVRFRITIDGAAPGAAHGTDVDGAGSGIVTAERLYHLVRQDGPIVERSFEIEFLDPGLRAYAFTFG